MILRAACVVPVSGAPIHDGFVEISRGRIARVGRWREVERQVISSAEAARGAVEDLGDTILTPGLVNPHTHLELTAYAGLLPPAPFWRWIVQLARLRWEPGQAEREERGATEGARLSLRVGVTCVGDISRLNVAWRMLKPLPIRKVCFVELMSIADSPPRNLDELRAAVEAVEEDERLTVGITPHAPYSVLADQLRRSIELAERLNRPWCTHWAETQEEVAFLRGSEDALPEAAQAWLTRCGIRSPRESPMEFLASCVGSAGAGLLAHMNYVDDRELDALAEAGHCVVYCPRAHSFFAHQRHPMPRMLAAGVRVAIGTDSLASNRSLSPLEELQFVGRHVENAPGADALFRMITLDAAAALRLDARIGSLEAGKLADLAAFRVRDAGDEPVEALIREAPQASAVWVAGRRVHG